MKNECSRTEIEIEIEKKTTTETKQKILENKIARTVSMRWIVTSTYRIKFNLPVCQSVIMFIWFVAYSFVYDNWF